MSESKPSSNAQEANNRSNSVSATAPSVIKVAATAPAPPAWAAHTSTFSSNGPSASFTQFSATTAEILNRIRANPGNTLGTPAFEAKRAEVLQSYVTSDKLPTPSPIANSGRRGRGGRNGTPSQLKTEVGPRPSPASAATPTSARGSARGRGRGRGSRGGRGGKRKRSESFDEDSNGDDSDISSSYTPLPTRTKSGRNVNKPVAFVPTLPEPSPGVKRRRSTKTILAAQCKTCHRGTDPGNNRIVFCDVCSTAYHQYCHNPPIENEVVNVLEKEWLCGPCERSKQNVVEGTEGLTAAEGLSIEDKKAYLSTLSQARLVSLLLHATIRHPELPIFPANVQDLVPTASSRPKPTNPVPVPSSRPTQHPTPQQPHQPPASYAVTSPPNGIGSASNTPRSLHHSTSSEVDPAEAQLLGEISRYHIPPSHSSPSKQNPQLQPPSSTSAPNISTTTSKPTTITATTITPMSLKPIPTPDQDTTMADANDHDSTNPYDDNENEVYDTDPPAHYPKPGNGLARTLRPESEDLQWLVDDNFEVFSHGYRGDGSGVGADADADADADVARGLGFGLDEGIDG